MRADNLQRVRLSAATSFFASTSFDGYLHAAELIEGEVATHQMPGFYLNQIGLNRCALFFDATTGPAGTTRMENATRWGIGHTGNFANEPHSIRGFAVDAGQRRNQRFGVWMMRPGEHGACRAEFHDATEIQHGDTIREVPHHAKIVGDEQVADVL